MKQISFTIIVAGMLVWSVFAHRVLAQAAAQEDTELARKTQNPVSDLISLPFQNNFNFNVGHDNDTQYLLNIQPVMPMCITEN